MEKGKAIVSTTIALARLDLNSKSNPISQNHQFQSSSKSQNCIFISPILPRYIWFVCLNCCITLQEHSLKEGQQSLLPVYSICALESLVVTWRTSSPIWLILHSTFHQKLRYFFSCRMSINQQKHKFLCIISWKNWYGMLSC